MGLKSLSRTGRLSGEPSEEGKERNVKEEAHLVGAESQFVREAVDEALRATQLDRFEFQRLVENVDGFRVVFRGPSLEMVPFPEMEFPETAAGK